MEAGEQVTNKIEHRTLIRVLDNALQEAEVCAGYAFDAEAAGKDQLADFFREIQRMHARIAERAEAMLGAEGNKPRSDDLAPSTSAEGDPDPADVSPGQDIA